MIGTLFQKGDLKLATIVNEEIVTGRVKRRLIDKAAKRWQRLSYWTKASDVEFNDGKTAEEKVTSIDQKLGGLTFYEDEDGKKWVVGADSVPKKLGSLDKIIAYLTELGCSPASDEEDDVLSAIQGMVNAIVQKLKDAGLLDSKDNSTLEDLLNVISRIKSVPVSANYSISHDKSGKPDYSYIYLHVDGKVYASGHGSLGSNISTNTKNIKMIIE